MLKLLFLSLLLPTIGQSHPGIGIVKDSKGNVYYTDLKHVWKITSGNKSVVVPNVHTHELYIDQHDNLYGEGGYYDDKALKFYHYLWVYRPNGKIDTVTGMKEAYVHQDFSLAKDKKRNEYYIKRFLIPHNDTRRIYRKSPDGKEIVLATGNFKDVNWLHPQDDGSLLFVSNNSIYRVDSLGSIQLVKENVADSKSSNKPFSNNILVWGVWQDNVRNIYVAVHSDQSIKKIDTSGHMTDIYKLSGNWSPLHGVFDNDNKLWVLESSDKNDVRVTCVETIPLAVDTMNKTNSNLFIYIIISGVLLGIAFLKLRHLHWGLRRLKS